MPRAAPAEENVKPIAPGDLVTFELFSNDLQTLETLRGTAMSPPLNGLVLVALHDHYAYVGAVAAKDRNVVGVYAVRLEAVVAATAENVFQGKAR